MKPKEAQGAQTDAQVIHVMPPDFRGGKVPLTAPIKPAPAPVPDAKPIAAPKSPPKQSSLSKKRRLSPILILALSMLALVIMGAAYVLATLNQVPATNVVTNTQVNTPTPTPEPECGPSKPCDGDLVCSEDGECVEPVSDEPVEPAGGVDTDSDGLTDIEEILFGSDPRNADTDRDSYLDGNEVYHLYNPRGDAPSLLTDTGFTRVFVDEAVSYEVSYPARWTTQLIDAPTERMVFRVPTGEYMEILVEPKSAQVDVAKWYLDQFPDTRADELSGTKTGQGYTGIESPDRLSTYLDLGERVYSIHYHLADAVTINFLTTYQMIVNSLVVANP